MENSFGIDEVGFDTLISCTTCKKVIPDFSINFMDYSNQFPDRVCKCKHPGYPETEFSKMIKSIFDWIVGKKG